MRGIRFSERALHAIAVLGGLLATVMLPSVARSQPNYRAASPRALLQALRDAPPEQRATVAAAMVERRAEVVPLLRESVRSGDRTGKLLACSLIAELRDRGSVDAVLGATADADVKVRRRAATVLRILADSRSAPRLRELLDSETDLGVLKTSLAALGRLGERRDVAAIEPFLLHADDGVRVVAAGALAMLGDQRGLDLIIQATYAADPSVRKSATYALGFFTAAAAGERLQAILDDPQAAWRSYALVAQAQRRLATQSLAERLAALDGWARARSRTLAEWAVDRLTDIGTPEAVAVLRKVRDRQTPVGVMAERRLRVLGATP